MQRIPLLVCLALVLAAFAGPAVPVARASGCTSASPLYSAVAGDASAKPEWLFAGVAGPPGNGYTGTVYVSIFNPSSASAPVHADIFEYDEVSGATSTVDIFSEGVDLTGGRSETFTFNGLPPHPTDNITVPSGKVHFDVRATGPVNVYAEQWLVC